MHSCRGKKNIELRILFFFNLPLLPVLAGNSCIRRRRRSWACKPYSRILDLVSFGTQQQTQRRSLAPERRKHMLAKSSLFQRQ
jgi:hypothetical protein